VPDFFDGDLIWTALALVLVIEGLTPLLSPSRWRRMCQQMLTLRDGQIRFFAFCSVLAGLVLLLVLA
jgi:uncharacterized protein